jgi:hypothetical protein
MAPVTVEQCFRDREHVVAVGDWSGEPALVHALAAERFPFRRPIFRPVECGNQKPFRMQRVRRFSQQSRRELWAPPEPSLKMKTRGLSLSIQLNYRSSCPGWATMRTGRVDFMRKCL